MKMKRNPLGLIAAVFVTAIFAGIVATATGCGAAAKQTNTSTNNSNGNSNGSESQPSNR